MFTYSDEDVSASDVVAALADLLDFEELGALARAAAAAALHQPRHQLHLKV